VSRAGEETPDPEQGVSGLGDRTTGEVIPKREQGSRWSLKREDLSGDWALKDCPEIDFEGRNCHSLGRVALLSRIGKGGMGVVYFGVNPRLQSEVAIKVLPRALLEHQEGLVERFLQEARLAARLHSDHLVSVLDVDEDPNSGAYYIVMEYVNGFSAAVWRIQNSPRPSESAALDICLAASKGLAVAHKGGIIHRDIKPANILIPYEDGKPHCHAAKLADLGLARSDTSDGSLTGTQHTMGTPGYLAPEQAVDAKRAGKPADVFGMAATLYALLCGKAPFAGESPSDALVKTALGKYKDPREYRDDISHITAALIEKCLRPDPKKRFPDGAALLNALTICRANIDADSGVHLPELSLLAGKPLTKTMVPVEATRTMRKKPTGKTQLTITSTPPGATVEIKRAARGKTPLVVTGLDPGKHRVRLTLEFHLDWETAAAVAKAGEATELHADLERDTGTLTAMGGAPGAKLQMMLEDVPDRPRTVELDENGALVGGTG
jgi:serine/threonine protein kinase